MEKSEPKISRTMPETAFLVKYLAASIALVPAILSSEGLFAHPARIVVVVPLALWGLFCLTAIEVRACEQVLKCRRFLFWRNIPYEEIVQCKDSWNPWFGYLKLTRFVPPWGKVYFVTLRSASGNPRDLVAYINSRRAGIKVSSPAEDFGVNDRMSKNVSFCLLMCFVGVVWAFMWAYLFPDSQRPLRLESFPGWLTAFITLYNRAFDWPWAIGTIAILVGGILGLRFRHRAWILAFGVGVLLGSIGLKALN